MVYKGVRVGPWGVASPYKNLSRTSPPLSVPVVFSPPLTLNFLHLFVNFLFLKLKNVLDM